MAKLAGATVTTTSLSDDKLQIVKTLGGKHTIAIIPHLNGPRQFYI